MMTIRHNTVHAVVDTFKQIVDGLLCGNGTPIIKSGIVEEAKIISIHCYTQPEQVGILLGRNEYGIKTPTKLAIMRILKHIAFLNGIHDVQLRVEDFSKMPPEVKPETTKQEA